MRDNNALLAQEMSGVRGKSRRSKTGGILTPGEQRVGLTEGLAPSAPVLAEEEPDAAPTTERETDAIGNFAFKTALEKAEAEADTYTETDGAEPDEVARKVKTTKRVGNIEGFSVPAEELDRATKTARVVPASELKAEKAAALKKLAAEKKAARQKVASEKKAAEEKAAEEKAAPVLDKKAQAAKRVAAKKAEAARRAEAEAKEKRRQELEEQKAKQAKRLRPDVKRKSVADLLRTLRLGTRNKFKDLAGRGLVSNLEFFQQILEGNTTVKYNFRFPESDPNRVATFVEELPKEQRDQFFALVEVFVNAGYLYDANSILTAQDFNKKSLPQLDLTNELDAFVAQYYPGDLALKNAVRNFARSLRTVALRGYEAGEIILESKTSQQVYDAMLAKLNTTYEKRVAAAANQEATPILSSRDLAIEMRNELPKNNFLRALLTRFIDSGVNVPVIVDPSLTVSGNYVSAKGNRAILVNPRVAPGTATRVLLHEMSHAITTHAYTADPRVRAFVDDLLVRAQKFAAKNNIPQERYYGLRDSQEFIAEAFTNHEFRAFLDRVPTSLWQRFKRFIRSAILGLSATRQSALDVFLEYQDALIDTEAMIVARRTGNVSLNSLAGTSREKLSQIQARVDLKNRTVSGWQKVHLGWMNLDFMERKYRKVFNEVSQSLGIENPLTLIRNAVTRVAGRAQQIENAMAQLTQRTNAIDKQERRRLYTSMQSATQSGYDPTKPESQQPWLFNKAGDYIDEVAVRQTAADYRALGEAQPLFAEWRDLLRDSFEGRRSALVLHALQINVADASLADLTTLSKSADFAEFGANMRATGVDVPDSTQEVVKEILNLAQINGPYFPLKREGEYVTYRPADDPADTYFTMWPTRALAQLDAERVGAGAFVERKASKDFRGSLAAHSTATAITSKLTSNLKGADQASLEAKKNMVQAVNNAVVELLGDQILYSSRLKRKGVQGAQPDDMPGNLDSYVRSTINAISTLESSHDYERALNLFLEIDTENTSEEAQNIAALVRTELLHRAKSAATDREVAVSDRVLGSIGFYTYLGAPSYWILNATQTAAVGVPVLAGLSNTSLIAATKHMSNAHMILKRATKGKGWKALDNLDAVTAELSTDQAQIVEQLVSDGIIKGTLAHELGLLLGNSTGIYNKVTSFLQTVPEMLERWNRVSMALAAMDAGVTDYVTIRDIVEASQFNYDAANRARLLKTAPLPLGGGARQFVSPVMMFKVFGINMAEIVYQNLYDGLGLNKDISPEERATAWKVFGGIVASHTLLGGVVGGMGLGLGDIIVSAVNALLDDEDKLEPERMLDQFLADHTNDYVARLVMRGLPAAAGVDFSASVNIGSLLFMSRDNDWAEYGGFEQSVYGLLGPVAQYVAGGVRELARFGSGEASFFDFVEKAVPLKAARVVLQSFDYADEGLETRQGQTFYNPADVDAADILITALGLRPAVLSQQQLRFYPDRAFSRTMGQRKSEIISRAIEAKTAAERRNSLQERMEWNKKMRERRNFSMIITPSTVSRSATSKQEIAYKYANEQFTDYNRFTSGR